MQMRPLGGDEFALMWRRAREDWPQPQRWDGAVPLEWGAREDLVPEQARAVFENPEAGPPRAAAASKESPSEGTSPLLAMVAPISSSR